MTTLDLLAIIGEIRFTMFPDWKLVIGYDESRVYLQVHNPKGVCNVTGGSLPWSGRKWMLSPHMTKSEVVYTAYKALEAAVEHEFRESFLYRGVAISDPHRNIDVLVEIAGRADALDVR